MDSRPLENVTSRNQVMTKWGVRLIGIFFFAWAISDSYKLFSGLDQSKYFFGFYVNIGGKNFDFLAWVQVIALVLIGLQLLRIQPSGRFGALAVLWMYALEAGIFLIWMTYKVAQGFYHNYPMNFSINTWFGKADGPIAFLLIFLGAFILYFIQAHFLTRKEVKQLFQKPVPTGETR